MMMLKGSVFAGKLHKHQSDIYFRIQSFNEADKDACAICSTAQHTNSRMSVPHTHTHVYALSSSFCAHLLLFTFMSLHHYDVQIIINVSNSKQTFLKIEMDASKRNRCEMRAVHNSGKESVIFSL